MKNFHVCGELAEAFARELRGTTCEDLQKAFTRRTHDLWNAAEYKAFSEARGSRCAIATAWVTRWVVKRLLQTDGGQAKAP